MLSHHQFIARIDALPPTICSITGNASYSDFIRKDNWLQFTRTGNNSTASLNLDILFAIYQHYPYINTTIVKAHHNAIPNSPAVAILRAMDLIDQDGFRRRYSSASV